MNLIRIWGGRACTLSPVPLYCVTPAVLGFFRKILAFILFLELAGTHLKCIRATGHAGAPSSRQDTTFRLYLPSRRRRTLECRLNVSPINYWLAWYHRPPWCLPKSDQCTTKWTREGAVHWRRTWGSCSLPLSLWWAPFLCFQYHYLAR